MECDEHFGIDRALYDSLLARSSPLPPKSRLRPSRLLLIKVHEATHGADSLLLKQTSGVASAEQRERVTLELWRKLTGDTRSSSKEIYAEACASARKKLSSLRAPSPTTRRWLETAPSATDKIGFGSTGARLLHPGVRAGQTDDRLATPDPGAYDAHDENVRSRARSSSFAHKSYRSTKNAEFQDRKMPWERGEHGEVLELGGPAVGFRPSGKSCLNMANVALAKRPSPAFASPTVSRRSAEPSPLGSLGPGAYDTTRNDIGRTGGNAARPSAAFRGKAGRGSLFGVGYTQAVATDARGATPLRATGNALDGTPTARRAASPRAGSPQRPRSAPPARPSTHR